LSTNKKYNKQLKSIYGYGCSIAATKYLLISLSLGNSCYSGLRGCLNIYIHIRYVDIIISYEIKRNSFCVVIANVKACYTCEYIVILTS